jgi:hypothetical protein
VYRNPVFVSQLSVQLESAAIFLLGHMMAMDNTSPSS